MKGQFGKVQIVLNFFQQPSQFLLRIQLFGLLHSVETILLHVQKTQVEKFLFVTLLRYGLDEQSLGKVHMKRHNHFLGMAVVACAHFHDAQGEEFGVGFFQFFLIFKRKGAVDASVDDVQIVDICHSFFAFNVKNIDVMQNRRDHHALGVEFFNQVIAPLDFLSLFEAQFLRKPKHLLSHPLCHF